MKNNKKGFTLTELIAVMLILSIVISIATITFTAIRRNILKRDYNNLVVYLESKATEYANETNITTVSVEKLIKEGIVSPDDESSIYNPETKESMNCYIIKSTFENGAYTSKLSTDLGTKSDGTCNTYTETQKFEICEYNKDTNECKSIDSNKWFKDDILLSVKYSNSLSNNVISDEGATFEWTSTNGFTSTDSYIATSTSSVSQNAYKCEVTIGNSIGEATSKILIDKQVPNAYEILFDTGWTVNKEIVINATDMGGSGVKEYALVGENDACGSYQSSKKFIKTENGTYKYCVIDNAGNVATDTIKIDKIDNTKPKTPIITPSDGIGQSSWHKADFTLNFTTDTSQSLSAITYYYGTSKSNMNLSGTSVLINSNYSGETMYVKACNDAGTCSGISSYTILYDNTAPTYSSGGSIGAGSLNKPKYVDNAGGSGNVTVYTCVTTGYVPSNTDSCFSASEKYSYSCGTTYYLYSYAVDGTGNKSLVYNHATNNGATYYSRCHSSSSSNRGSSSSSSHSSSCDNTCKMQKNSEAWHSATTDAEKNRLHDENEKLAKNNSDCKGSCSYNKSTGSWSDSSGNKLYNVSGGKK